jgi:hypothetical protein
MSKEIRDRPMLSSGGFTKPSGAREIFVTNLDTDVTNNAIIVVVMKNAVVCIALLLVLSTHAFAVLRSRYPIRPTPPFRGELIIIEDGSFQKAGAKASK